METNRRRRRALAGVLLTVLAFAPNAWLASARGQGDGRVVTIFPSTSIVDFQYVALSYSGFPAGKDTRIRQCPKRAKRVTQCKKDSQYAPMLREPGDSRIPRTGSDGSGTDTFIVKSGEIENAEGKSFKCDLRNDCVIAVFEVDGTGADIGFDAAALAAIPFARSTIACPNPKGPGRIAGSGTTNIASNTVQWQAETCIDPLNLRLSYIVTNSPQGKEAFVAGLTDSEFAISGVPLKDHEREQLTAAGREFLQIPIAVGSLSIIYNYWEDLDRCDSDVSKQRIESLRMSPDTVAKVITGRIGDMSNAVFAEENQHLIAKTKVKRDGQCVQADSLPTRRIRPIARADNSSATYILSSWLLAAAHDAWASAGEEFSVPTEIFPSYNAVDLRTGSDAVARQVRTFEGGQQVNGVPGDLWIGFADTSVAKLVGLPSVAVRNAAGSYVTPIASTVASALQAATLNADGTVAPNYVATAPTDNYPLLVTSYLITDKNRLTQGQADTIRAFAAYAITDGQTAAEDRGYLPLPTEMQASSAASIEQISGVEGSGGNGGSGGGDDGPAPDDPFGDDASDDDVDDDGDVDDLSDLTDGLLARARGGDSGGSSGGSVVAAPSTLGASPVEGSPASSLLGPGGGPAGVVRALTVFLGLPMLLALGFGSIAGGRLMSVVSLPRGNRVAALLPRWVWRSET